MCIYFIANEVMTSLLMLLVFCRNNLVDLIPLWVEVRVFFLLDVLPCWSKSAESALQFTKSWRENSWINAFSRGISFYVKFKRPYSGFEHYLLWQKFLGSECVLVTTYEISMIYLNMLLNQNETRSYDR